MKLSQNTYIYLLIAALVTYLVRVIPLFALKGEIKSNFLKSFLYYVPYVTLSVMTFPAIIGATSSIFSGIAALAVGALVAWIDGNLFRVSIACCIAVFFVEIIMFH